jgi:hypothetical protein
LRLQRKAMAIFQDLVDQFGFAASYNGAKRFVRKFVVREPKQFDRLSFVMTLRHSRRSFRRVVWNLGQETWARLHEQA